MKSLLTYAWAKAAARTVATAGMLTAGSFVGSRVGDLAGAAYVKAVQSQYPRQVPEDVSAMNFFGYAKYTPVLAFDFAGGLLGLGAAIIYKKRKSKEY